MNTLCRNVLAWISRGHPVISADPAHPNKSGNHAHPCVCSGMLQPIAAPSACGPAGLQRELRLGSHSSKLSEP